MKNSTLREKRRAAGLCITCGAERIGRGRTTRFCAPCAEKERARCRQAYANRTPEQIAKGREQQKRFQQKQRAARIAAHRCTDCGGPIVGFTRRATSITCGACRKKATEASTAFRKRARRKLRGTPPDREPTIFYLGSAAPRLVGGHTFRLTVDRVTQEAVVRMRDNYKAAERKAGREPRSHQVSRLVRNAVLHFERVPCLPLEKRYLLYGKEYDLHLRLDARTRAILERQAAQHFDGNRSRALRTMIVRGSRPRRIWKGTMVAPW